MRITDPLDPVYTLPSLIGRRASADPDTVFLRDLDHATTWTYARFDREVARWRDELASVGVEPGDAVVTLLPNCSDAVAIWVAVSRLGAVEAPVNPAYRGNLLAHMIRVADADVVVAAPEYLDSLREVLADVGVTTVVLTDPHRRAIDVDVLPGVLVVDGTSSAARSVDDLDVDPWDLSCILYTSGTTGPSKGVMVTWAQTLMSVLGCFPPDDLSSDDHWYVPYPLFHMSGRLCVYGAALLGSTAVIRRRFSLSSWWDDIDANGCTTALVIGSVPQLLNSLTASDDDPGHALRHVQMAPMPENAHEFAERFGVRLNTVFNMTEISVATHTNWQPWRPGSVGQVRPGYNVRIVDEHDLEVGPGVIGEITVRSDIPWALNQGYWRMPDKTIEAWRNGWFHTGDAGYVDSDGWYYFVDRIKDAIRRGGENISSMELEAEIAEHPGVLECAAIGVPADLGEEDVLVFVVAEKADLSFDELHEFCRNRLPRFMVPRYFVRTDHLPKTPTEKVRKTELKDLLDSYERWDALAD